MKRLLYRCGRLADRMEEYQRRYSIEVRYCV